MNRLDIAAVLEDHGVGENSAFICAEYILKGFNAKRSLSGDKHDKVCSTATERLAIGHIVREKFSDIEKKASETYETAFKELNAPKPPERGAKQANYTRSSFVGRMDYSAPDRGGNFLAARQYFRNGGRG